MRLRRRYACNRYTGLISARRPRCSPTMPSTVMRDADLDAGDRAAAEEHDADRAGGVEERALERGTPRDRAHPHRVHPARHRRVLPERTRRRSRPHRRADAIVTDPPPPLPDAWPLPLPPPSTVNSPGSGSRTPWISWNTSSSLRLGWRLNGTDVTLTCGRRLNDRASDSAVWSCRMRCQSAAVLAVGQQHAHLGLAVGRARARPRSSRRAGAGGPEQSTSSSGMSPSAELAPLVGELVGAVLVEDEVHGAQLVGMQRAGVLDRARRGEVERGRRTRARRGGADRRVRGSGHVVDLECLAPPPRTACSRTRTNDHDRDEHDDHPGAVRELRDRDDRRRRAATATAPMPLIDQPVLPARLLVREVVLGHAGLREREADVNTPMA